MHVTQEGTDEIKHPSPPSESTAGEPSGLSGKLGKWAFEHKDFFKSDVGNLAFRNATRTLVAIVPYLFLNVGIQHGFKNTVGFKGAEKNQVFGKTLSGALRNATVQSTAAIAFSFTAFRSTCKAWMASYDRIFNAQSKEEAADVIAHLPGQVANDLVHIVPSEFAATGLSAGILAGIRGGLKTPEPFGSQKNNWKQFVELYPNDLTANVAGYAAFFEATDRLYSVFNHTHPNGAFVNGTVPQSSDQDPVQKRHGTFTNDTPARLVFRNVGSVAVAAIPYIALQRYANMKTGNYNPPKNGYLKDVAIGLASWEIPFAVFTSGIELYQKKYDALFKKLEDKYHGRTVNV